MQTKILAGGGFTSSDLGDSLSPAKKRVERATIVLMVLLLSFCLTAIPAFAGSVEGNTAYNNNAANVQDQTIVGEGQNNNVIITNSTDESPSPTGVLMANLPLFIIGAFIAAGTVVIIARAKKKAGEEDE